MKTYLVPVTIDIGSITRMLRVEADNEQDAIDKAAYMGELDAVEEMDELISHLNAIGAELEDAFVDIDCLRDVREVE